jgi:uncharacterized protein
VDLVVGFDLDMTLVDSRAGIAATLSAVVADLGVTLTDADTWPTIGIPLEDSLRRWLPADQVAPAILDYRSRYPVLGVPITTLLPGARGALEAVHALGGRTAIISAKAEPGVRAVLAQVGIDADIVVGGRYAHAKAGVLREIGAQVYVGDHPGDVVAAIGSDAVSVAVSTGPTPAADLSAAGADIVLGSLQDFPAWLEEHVLGVRLATLDLDLREIGSRGPVVVAFSGGTDSAFVLAAAVRALGAGQVVAATAVSPSLASGELERAASYAASLGVRHLTPQTHELDREGYVVNAGNRCYFCKSELVDVLTALDDVTAGATVLTGTNADDVRAGFRPGIAAADERGAHAPLRDAGLTKVQVREASRRWGLVTWDKPAAACLSSRVAYGVPVTREGLARIDQAELAVRAELTGAGLTVADLRVRDLGDGAARVDVDPGLLPLLLADGEPSDLGREVVAAVLATGFATARVDDRGFRSGSMNELLPQPELYR